MVRGFVTVSQCLALRGWQARLRHLDGNGVGAAFVLPGVAETPMSMLFGIVVSKSGCFRQPVRYGFTPCSTTVVLACISTGEELVRRIRR